MLQEPLGRFIHSPRTLGTLGSLPKGMPQGLGRWGRLALGTLVSLGHGILGSTWGVPHGLLGA